MLLFWPCLLLATASAHRVVESTEDLSPPSPLPPRQKVEIPPPAPSPRQRVENPPLLSSKVDSYNSTALYPVNKTEGPKIKSATSWKIETTFGDPKLDSNVTESKEELTVDRPENKSSSSEFRASQHLGNFLDEDSLEAGGGHSTHEQPGGHHHFGGYGREKPIHAPPRDFAGVIKKPPTGFIHSLKDHKFPKDLFKPYDFPYKLESPILTKVKDGWKPTAPGLESHPTDESPVRVPAGDLYSLPDPFKIRPGTTDEDFGLEFSHDAKEHAIKKPRVNPWKNLLHLITALIPVGIIVSALTPSVITIEPQHNELCRRRLLCELNSETSFSDPSFGHPHSTNSKIRSKLCYRLRCEDPEGLTRTLQWLLSHQRPNSGPTAIIDLLTYPRPLERPYSGLGPTGDQWDLKFR